MKKSQKRVCGNCKALEQTFVIFRCTLGYKIKTVKIGKAMGHDLVDNKPLEPCPKPLTNMQFFEAMNLAHK